MLGLITDGRSKCAKGDTCFQDINGETGAHSQSKIYSLSKAEKNLFLGGSL